MRYEYVVIAANPPGAARVPVAVLVRTVADDHLDARVRDDLKLVLDSDSVALVKDAVRMFVERAGGIGGAAVLAELEATLSNFLTVSPRSVAGGTGDPDTVLVALASEHLSRRI